MIDNMWTPACYVYGHAPEDHREESKECEVEDCDCIMYEPPEEPEEAPDD